jgi:hypothetical protein
VAKSQPKGCLTIPLFSVWARLCRGRSWVAQESIVIPAATVLPRCRWTCRIKPTRTSSSN